jgi:hypothetical protein
MPRSPRQRCGSDAFTTLQHTIDHMKKTALALTSAAALLTGCATPTVIQTKQVGDEALSCSDLRRAYDEAERFERDARSERGVTGKNVAAALFFWPAMVGTYMNTDDAIRAARERKDHLNAVSRQKRCP